VASVWITPRAIKGGAKRYRVEYRLGGRESRIRYGGSFRTGAEAKARKRWIAGELAALRAPDLTMLVIEAPRSPLLADACDAWRQGRIDVTAGTGALHR
jgi:hypothetical protein